MARGTLVFIEGTTVGLNKSGKKVGGDGPDKDKLAVDQTVTVPKKTPFTINGVEGKRLSDLKNGDTVTLSEVGGVVANGVATSEVDPVVPTPAVLKGVQLK